MPVIPMEDWSVDKAKHRKRLEAKIADLRSIIKELEVVEEKWAQEEVKRLQQTIKNIQAEIKSWK